MNEAPRILIIRRDNIGDLACTTPVISALRRRFPNAYLCAFVTSYNRAVLEHHPALDAVVAYTKAKHREHGVSRLATYVDRARLLLELRRRRFDYAILAAPGFQRRPLRLARLVAPRHIVGFVEPGRRAPAIDLPVAWELKPWTEAEDVFCIMRAFGVDGPPGPLQVAADPVELARLQPAVAALRDGARRVVGIHLSARKPSQRWPAARFAELIAALHDRHQCAFVIVWAPGDADNPAHPGDDAKAREVLAALAGRPVLPVPTTRLAELMAAIALCDDFICADGGAMHLAAASGKPIVCLFGASSPQRWRPWGVPYRLLQAPSEDVIDIGVASVAAAYAELSAANAGVAA